MPFDFPEPALDGQLFSPVGGPTYVYRTAVGAWLIKTGATNTAYVSKAGDNMMGPLVLLADPTAPFEATTKQYADRLASDKLEKSGGTMTGSLMLARSPAYPLEAATKEYADGIVASINVADLVKKSGDTMTGHLTVPSLGVGSGAGTAYFGYTGSHYLHFDGNYTFILSDNLAIPGRLNPYGYQCRAGYSGNNGANVFNLMYYLSGSNGTSLYIDNTNMGGITTGSDYRIKKDVELLPDMWETVKKLRPIRYTQAEFSPPSHKQFVMSEAIKAGDDAKRTGSEPRRVDTGPLFVSDDLERWGFVAHELQATLTLSAATGVKDAPDTIQSPNQMVLLAAVTKALQEAMMRIEQMAARIAALEGSRRD